MSDALTVKEVSERLRVSETTVLKMINSEDMPHVRLGKRIIIYTDQLQLWIDKRSFNRIEAPTNG